MEHLDHPSPHFNDAKMARFCSFPRLHRCFGGRGINCPSFYSVQDCRLHLSRGMQINERANKKLNSNLGLKPSKTNQKTENVNFTVSWSFIGVKHLKYLLEVKNYYQICLNSLSNGILLSGNLFLLHFSCRILRAKTKQESFQKNGSASNGSRTIPVGFQSETMSYHSFLSFVMIVICQG